MEQISLEKRKHVHVTYSYRGFKRACKFWLEPEVSLESELNEIQKLIDQHKDILTKQLGLFYDHKPLKAVKK